MRFCDYSECERWECLLLNPTGELYKHKPMTKEKAITILDEMIERMRDNGWLEEIIEDYEEALDTIKTLLTH